MKSSSSSPRSVGTCNEVVPPALYGLGCIRRRGRRLCSRIRANRTTQSALSKISLIYIPPGQKQAHVHYLLCLVDGAKCHLYGGRHVPTSGPCWRKINPLYPSDQLWWRNNETRTSFEDFPTFATTINTRGE